MLPFVVHLGRIWSCPTRRLKRSHLLRVEVEREVVDADFDGRFAAEEVAEHAGARRRELVAAARQHRRPAAQTTGSDLNTRTGMCSNCSGFVGVMSRPWLHAVISKGCC